MGQVYVTPAVPGGEVGRSAALAIAQGARTPGEIAYMTMVNFVTYAAIMAILLVIIIAAQIYYTGKITVGRAKETFVAPRNESDERCATF